MGLNSDTLLRLAGRARHWARAQSPQTRALARRLRKPSTIPLLLATVVLPVLAVFNAFVATAAPGTMYVAGATFPFNGVWLESADGGHYWDASGGNGLCRVDADATSPTGFTENIGTCDVQAKKPTQAVVGPVNADGTYFVYSADMSSKSGGPLRLTYDPNADPDPTSGLGRGAIVAGSGILLGGLNTVGFFSDAGGNFKNSSVALGPCNRSTVNPVPTATPCLALYLGFERSRNIERINFVDQPVAQQTIENISATADPRKGVRFGIAMFHNANGTDDLYIDELGGLGVSLLTDVATCAPNTNGVGGCAASITPIGTFFPQGIAVKNDASGNGQSIFVADTPRDIQSTVLRYTPSTGLQDVISSSVPQYESLLNPGELVTTYQFIQGLAINPHTGDLFIGDDPTFAILVNPPLAKGHIWTIKADANGVVPADCVATPLAGCPLPPPPVPNSIHASLFAYGVTAPKGGIVLVPAADGQTHLWAGDHSQGFCRMDPVPGTGIQAFNAAACDDGTVLGSAGQAVYDDSLNADGVTHNIYIAQNDHLSPGVLKFVYDPTADNGHGMIVNPPVIMAPNAGLDGDKANGVSLGPCVKNADGTLKFPTCKHALYMGGLLDGFIRRINNPEDDPRNMIVDVVAETTEARAGVGGRGINGSMGMLGDNLYMPENQGFTVVPNISKCPVVTSTGTTPCASNPLPIGQFGFIFASGVGTDPDTTRSSAGLVYGCISPGAANATCYQYDVATNTSRLYVTQGQMPAAGTADATVYCTLTCTRPADPALPPGSLVSFSFAQGVNVNPATGDVFISEDKFAGARGGRGHVWLAPFINYPPACTSPGVPAGCVTPVPTPTPPPPPATLNNCAITINVPSLPSGQTYWVQFTAHNPGTLKATWTIPVAQSAQLLLYSGNPFAGLADPVAKGPTGKPLAVQNTSNTASFSISSANQPAGTYTVQFFNGSNAFAGTTGTISFVNDAATPCPASPATSNILN
jgi:hypothetical protein